MIRLMPLVSRVEKRLLTCSNFLSQAGKLEMVNYVLSSLLTFVLSTLKIHKELLTNLININDIVSGKGEIFLTIAQLLLSGNSFLSQKTMEVWL